MARSSRIYWPVPTAMGVALLVGIALAVGHHLFYASLAGTEAPTGTLTIVGADISRQQLNTAVGTAFAFLVKSFLTITVSIAFVQAFWRAVHTSKKGPTLAGLDSTYSLLTNFLGVFLAHVWTDFPVPLLLASIAWCVPIASIVTPATLSVQTAAVLPAPSSNLTVRNFDFTSLDFVAPLPQGPQGFCFDGPSQPVQRTVAAVAAQGQILSIPIPSGASPNATWSIDFWGPSLECQDVSGSLRDSIWANILDHWGNVTDWSYAYGYLAWVSAPNSSLPFVEHGELNSTTTSITMQSTPMTYGSPASIFVATLPQMFNYVFVPSTAPGETCRFFGSDSFIYSYPVADDLCLPGMVPPDCYGMAAWTINATLLQCNLKNSSHSATFDYVNGTQIINVTTDSQTSVPVSPHECFVTLNSTNKAIGGIQCGKGGGECPLDAPASRVLSYQALGYAFFDLLLGSITLGGYGRATYGGTSLSVEAASAKIPGVQVNSTIGRTILMDTNDLAFIVNFNGVNQSFSNLQESVSHDSSAMYRGISDKMLAGTRGSLKETLEILFQNITISLLADDYLQPNYSSPYAPTLLTNVTFNAFDNVYIYSRSTLWAAYGAAILLTLVALGVGVASLFLNEAAFTNDFSTILRVGRMAPMSEAISVDEYDGRQPLPKHLAKARVMLGSDAMLAERQEPSSGVDKAHPSTAITTVLPKDGRGAWHTL